MNTKLGLFTCAQTGMIRDAAAERAREDRQRAAIRESTVSQREAEIERVCAEHELETDEFMTRYEKAEEILGRCGW